MTTETSFVRDLVYPRRQCHNAANLSGAGRMSNLLYIWREQQPLDLTPAAIARQLDAEQDVEGLADLPIKEMIDWLKEEFHGLQEVAGRIRWISGEERFHATWSWQYLRIESENLNEEHRDKFFDLAKHFGCPVYDPGLNLKMG
jgi:hypothetical protein